MTISGHEGSLHQERSLLERCTCLSLLTSSLFSQNHLDLATVATNDAACPPEGHLGIATSSAVFPALIGGSR